MKIEVHSLKYDKRLSRKWPLQLTERTDSLIIGEGVFSEEINHSQIGRIASGTTTREYFWTDRWFNVFLFISPDRASCSYYCNLSSPVEFDGQILSYVDFDIDLIVDQDLAVRILDEDEFAVNSSMLSYPPDVIENISLAKSDLLDLIRVGAFPFNSELRDETRQVSPRATA
jgi:protein associated with RNAse G/E